MDKNSYIKRDDLIIETMARAMNAFELLVRDYYLDSPSEKGKKNTEFYKEMSRTIAEFERRISDMQYALDHPDEIQGYDTR
jgi:hypothetical protein